MSLQHHPAVQCDGVAHRFGVKWALRGVSLAVQPGEIVALLGKNGSGKSTLIRAIATALRPTRGTVRVYGHDIRTEAGAVREISALVGHATGVYEDLTVTENLSFAVRMTGEDADAGRIQAVIEQVGLGHEAHSRARFLSAGQQRRIALARVLLRPVRLLLLDEPYTSFDDEGVARVNELVSDLRGRGGAAIIITHDFERARRVVDRTLRLDQGALVEPPPVLKVAHG
ncbi:MAG TPA: heme ABC exporter ATP-binding protein CcmA [Gemmatimonadaceae bacterium]|nr:heme ABC exporter ATP-binding protein CcmA [Gemmatimonadaceae bacterium]